MPPVVFAGIESTFTGALVPVRQLEDYLDIMDPDDYPLLQAVGLNSYDVAITNTTFEWQIDYLIPSEDSIHVDPGAVAAVWQVHNAGYFNLHDVCLCGTELVRVLTIDTALNTITVERSFAGTAAAAHAALVPIYRLGPARPEGSSPGWAQQSLAVHPFNYTQIWDAVAEVTNTEEAMKQYAPDDLMGMRIDRAMKQLYVVMEQALFNGIRFQPATNTGRATGGLNQFILDNDALGGAALTLADIEDALQNVALRAGMSNVPLDMWCNAWPLRKLSAFGLGSIRTERTETTVGNVITQFLTNFGTVRTHFDRLVNPAGLYLLNMDRIQIGPLQGRGFASYSQDIGTTLTDSKMERIIGEYGFVIKGEDGTNQGVNVRITGFSLVA